MNIDFSILVELAVLWMFAHLLHDFLLLAIIYSVWVLADLICDWLNL